MHIYWGKKKIVQLKSRFLQHKFVQVKYFSDPIQKRAPARSVQLEAGYLEALL